MNVGDYVRTKDGYIAKFIRTENYLEYGEVIETEAYKFDSPIDEYNDEVNWEYAKEIIIKSSPNIIDLIEVGDIVNYEQLNGGVVLNKKEDSIDTWSILPNSLKNEDIKSVITKEQLKNCMYEVGE